MFNIPIQNKDAGQALVVVLVLAVVSVTLFTASTISVISASEGALMQTRSQEALMMAESGTNEAVLRLLRNPSYTGSTIAVGSAQSIITVLASPPTYTIQSVGSYGNVKKTITIVGQIQKGIFTRQSRTVQ